MRFTISAALLALATSVFAVDPTEGFDPLSKPVQGEKIPVGTTYEIQWTAKDNAATNGPISIDLLAGATPGTLTQKLNIAPNFDQTKNAFSWKVPAELGADATYGIKISLVSNPNIFQYGFPFQIISGGQSSSSTASSASSTQGYSTSSAPATVSTSAPATTVTASASLLPIPSSNTTMITAKPPTATPSVPIVSPTGVAASGASAVAAGSLAVFGGLVLAFVL